MAEEGKERNEVSLVKINSELYREITGFVKKDPIRFPTIKNFVEFAIRNRIDVIMNNLMYNIENKDQLINKDGTFKKYPEKHFASCIFCSHVFMIETKNRNYVGICNKCREIVKIIKDRI